MTITRLRTCKLKNPLGFDLRPLTLSWCVNDSSSKCAVASRVEIARDEEFSQVVFDSGFCEADSLAYRPDFTPRPFCRYYWRVAVRGELGDTARSAAAWFDVGAGDTPFSGACVSTDSPGMYVRKGFEVTKRVERAYLRVFAEGGVSVEINGGSVDSFCRDFGVYDVTNLLVDGKNAICACLEKSVLMLDLHVVDENGAAVAVVSDASWRQHTSDLQRVGEDVRLDARLSVKGRSGAAFDDSAWWPVSLAAEQQLPPLYCTAPRVVVKKTLAPVSVTGAVLDVGRSVLGLPEFINSLPMGESVTLFLSETPDAAPKKFCFMSDGSPIAVRPRFGAYRFRYIRVEGWQGNPACDQFAVLALGLDCEEIGAVETGNSEVNRQSVQWSQQGDVCGVEEAWACSGASLYYSDCYALYRGLLSAGGCDRPEAVVVAWNTYMASGDKSILAQSFDALCAAVQGCQTRRGHDSNSGCANRNSVDGGTDAEFVAAACNYQAVALLAKVAQVLNKTALAIEYSTLAAELKSAIQSEYFTPTGRLAVDTQTAHAMSLVLELTPSRRRTAERLCALVESNRSRPARGYAGWVCRALSDNGMSAYEVFFSLCAAQRDAAGTQSRLAPDSVAEWLWRCVCGLSPTVAGYRAALVAPKPSKKLGFARCELQTAVGLYKSGWRYDTAGALEVSVSVPFGASASVVLPLARQSDVVAIPAVRLRQVGENVEASVAAGDYTFAYTPIALDEGDALSAAFC